MTTIERTIKQTIPVLIAIFCSAIHAQNADQSWEDETSSEKATTAGESRESIEEILKSRLENLSKNNEGEQLADPTQEIALPATSAVSDGDSDSYLPDPEEILALYPAHQRGAVVYDELLKALDGIITVQNKLNEVQAKLKEVETSRSDIFSPDTLIDGPARIDVKELLKDLLKKEGRTWHGRLGTVSERPEGGDSSSEGGLREDIDSGLEDIIEFVRASPPLIGIKIDDKIEKISGNQTITIAGERIRLDRVQVYDWGAVVTIRRDGYKDKIHWTKY